MTNLINLAASLMDGADDVTITLDTRGDIVGISSEYLRGQAELICDYYGLPMQDGGKDMILREILERANVNVIEVQPWSTSPEGK